MADVSDAAGHLPTTALRHLATIALHHGLQHNYHDHMLPASPIRVVLFHPTHGQYLLWATIELLLLIPFQYLIWVMIGLLITCKIKKRRLGSWGAANRDGEVVRQTMRSFRLMGLINLVAPRTRYVSDWRMESDPSSSS